MGKTNPSQAVSLAIRQVLDSITFTSPLPFWKEFRSEEQAYHVPIVTRRLLAYSSSKSAPQSPFAIDVPKRTEGIDKWLAPSIMDQVILQACVSSLAEELEKTLDPKRVFSFRVNSDPNRLNLTSNQAESWHAFENETVTRAKSANQILYIDLQAAFASVPTVQVFKFLGKLNSQGWESSVLEVMFNAFGAAGIPFINDSIFFLGNAYLSIVDAVILKHTPNFIRFMDDYRIFCTSEVDAERVYEAINVDLNQSGFQLNLSKVKIETALDYLGELTKVHYDKTWRKPDRYTKAIVFSDEMAAKDLAAQVVSVIEQPANNFNAGLGRATLGAIRRMRLGGTGSPIEASSSGSGNPLIDYRTLVSSRPSLCKKALDLLASYSAQEGENWRTIWLLYVLQDLKPDGGDLLNQCVSLLEDIQKRSSTSTVVELWAKAVTKVGEEVADAEMITLDYLSAGKRYFGG